MSATLDKNTILKSFDSEAVTVDDTAGGVSLTEATYNPTVADGAGMRTRAVLATIKNVGAEIRIVLDDQTTVTAAIGFVIADGASFEVWGIDDITNFRAIRTGGGSSVITAIYSRRP